MKRLAVYLFCCLLCSHLFAQKINYPPTLLWRISGNGLQKPSYLFGTMHLQDRRIFHFSDSLYQYLQQADGYAMEVDPDKLMETFLQALSQPDTTGYLADDFNKKEFAKAAKDLEAQFGMPAGKITRKQAWLYQQGFKNNQRRKPDDMDAAMDMYLYNIAKRQGKWVGGIEDVEDQFNLIAEMGKSLNLEELLAAKGSGTNVIEKMIQIYAAQDLNKIEQWTNGMDKTEKDKLLLQRNIKMAYRMDSMAHTKSCFFAVGAAHLPGVGGVLELLQHKGFTVTPVISAQKIAPQNYKYKQVTLPWVATANTEKTYQVDMPGKAIPFSPGSSVLMRTYVDLGTGIFYFITSFPVNTSFNKDSVLQRFGQNFSKGNSIKPVSIQYKGNKGMEVYSDTSNYNYRLRLLLNGSEVVMAMVGAQKKSLLRHAEAERFFESLQLTAKEASVAKKLTDWYQYKEEGKAFSVSFPDKPEVNKALQDIYEKSNSQWIVTNKSYNDIANNAYYLLVIKEPKPGFYISSDQELFDETKKGLEDQGNIIITRYDTTTYKGQPAMWLTGTYKENNMLLKLLTVNRGNRSYALLAVYDPRTDTTFIEHFFDAMELQPFKAPSGWQQYNTQSSAYTTFAPPIIVKDGNNEDDTTFSNTHTFADKQTGYFVQITTEALSPYYSAINDSAFYADKLKEYVGYNDTLIQATPITNGAAKGMEYLIGMDVERRNYKRIRMLLHGDSTYVISFIAPLADVRDHTFDPPFIQFRFREESKPTNVYKNKTVKLLSDLSATDSVTFEMASAYLSKANFVKEDLPLLHKAMLQPYKDFNDAYDDTYDELTRQVAAFNDTSTVSFIQQHYTNLSGKNEELKYPLLSVLARIKTKQSYDVLKNLLLQHKPVKGNATSLSYLLDDSLQLAQTLYPQLLQLASDTLFAGVLVDVTNSLLDSNMLSLQEVLPYKEVLINRAKVLLTRLNKNPEAQLWSYTRWISLLRTLNGTESNAALQLATKSSHLYIQKLALMALVSNNQKIDAVIMQKIVADKVYRADVYEELKKLGKLHLFPAAYLNQKSIAESEMWNYASDEEDPQKIQFVGERMAVYKGTKSKFYLYKVQYSYDNQVQSYLGVVGPYKTGSAVQSGTDVIGLCNEPYDGSAIDSQLTSFLKERETNLK